MLEVLKKRDPSERELHAFDEGVFQIGGLLEVVLSGILVKKRPNIQVPKIHALVHFTYFIRRFGCAANFDSTTHERYHQLVVVKPCLADCRRHDGQEQRLSQAANIWTLVTDGV